MKYDSLEDAFLINSSVDFDIRASLSNFHTYFFSLPDSPKRTRKHIATPDRNSTCKRLNMFLRWMVRGDGRGVDLGIWTRIPTSALLIPCDVHVFRVSRELGLLNRSQNDWKAVVELSNRLSLYCPEDPVKYDFALFSIGVHGQLQTVLC